MGKRTDRAFDVMRERNRRYLDAQTQNQNQPENPADQDDPENNEEPKEKNNPNQKSREDMTPEEKAAAFHAGDLRGGQSKGKAPAQQTPGPGEPDTRLEKGDVPAMILSALLVFGPVFLILFGILALAWIFLH